MQHCETSMWVGGHFSLLPKIHLFKRKQKKIASDIMKLEAIVFGVMQVVTINFAWLNHNNYLLPGDYGIQSTIHVIYQHQMKCLIAFHSELTLLGTLQGYFNKMS